MQSASGSAEWASNPAEISTSSGWNSIAAGKITYSSTDSHTSSPDPAGTGTLIV